MNKPLVVSIPHDLGRIEASRRIREGLEKAQGQFGTQIASFEQNWTQEQGQVRLGALGQFIEASLDVQDDHVRVEVQLPWILSLIADKARHLIQSQGRLLLEKR